jgi:archaellin
MGCTCGTETRENTNPNIKDEDNKKLNKGENKKVDIERNTEEAIKRVELIFDKEICKNINSTIPKRIQTNLQSLKDIMQNKVKNLAEIQKAYVLFLWICENIDYDAQGYFNGSDVDCTPDGVFKNGKTVCSGYSRLYKDISLPLGLNVECVSCYAKGVDYEPGKKMNGTNHEYNVINLNQKWYPIDSTWGAGHIEGKEYQKAFNEFYFLADPELLIKSHFPQDEKWQLTKKKYTMEEFMKWPQINSNFHKYEFNKFSPEEGFIELKNANSQKFIIWGNNMEKKGAMCSIYLLQGNCYMQQLNSQMVSFNGDRFEANCIFNKKGRYKVELFGNDDGSNSYKGVLTYIVNVEKDAKVELKFPHTYAGSKDINIIEPLYDNLKSGEKVKFKIKSALGSIIIIDGQWHRLEKNDQGFFEKEITIQSQAGKNVIIGKPKGERSCSNLVAYSVI